MVDAWPGLHRAADRGPFFHLVRWDDDRPPAEESAGLGWQPMTDFAEHPLGLPSRVDAVRDSLLARGFDDVRASSALVLRVSASVAFLGVAARLLSPVLGSALTTGVVPDLGWHRLHWRPAAVGVLPLAIGPVMGQPLCPAGPPISSQGGRWSANSDARLLLDAAISAVLRLGEVVAGRFRVPPTVIAGNVASAVVGAAAIAGRSRPIADRARPGETIAQPVIRDLLAHGELAGTGRFVGQHDDDPDARFRRRSCCLLYRVTDAALCGDCVLHDQSRSDAGTHDDSAPPEQQDTGRDRHQQDRHR